MSVTTSTQADKRLKPWAVVSYQSGKPMIVSRLRKRSDAEDYKRCLRRLQPLVHFEVIYEA